MKKVLICLMALMASVYSWGAVTCGSPEDSGKTLRFSYSGSGSSILSTSSDWSNSTNKGKVTKIILEEGITELAANVFDGFTKDSIIVWPLSLKTVRKNAFNSPIINAIYYAGSPSDWAQIAFTYKNSHPFFNSVSRARRFYFYGNTTTKTSTLVLPPTIEEVKKLAFFHCEFGCINIPGTITNIGDSAFALAGTRSEYSSINCRKAPTLGTNSINSINFYIPSDATGYNVSPWTSHVYSKSVSGTIPNDYGAGIEWNLSKDGTLILNALTSNKETAFTASNQCPWYYHRRLVHKMVVRGDISNLSKALTWCFGIAEIEYDQTTIPSISSISYNTLFNSRDNVKLNIKAASLADESISNLESAPYNNVRLTISLSDTPIFTDNANNATWLANADSYLDVKTFDLQLGRSMSNAYYNTFCSPINMDAALVTSTFGAETKIYSFAGTSYTEETDELALNFNESQDYIEAGVPYLIWPANNVSNPSFTNVDLSDITTTAETVVGDHATFCGALAPVDVTSAQISAKSFIFLQANNTLNWASEGTLGGMRAYWLLTGDVPARALARRPVMKIGQSTTAIESVQTSDIRSQKIMRNGQLFIVRGEKMYNAQGQMIK